MSLYVCYLSYHQHAMHAESSIVMANNSLTAVGPMPILCL